MFTKLFDYKIILPIDKLSTTSYYKIKFHILRKCCSSLTRFRYLNFNCLHECKNTDFHLTCF